MADIVAVCCLFALAVSEAKTEIMWLTTKRPDMTTSDTEAAGQVCTQTTKFGYLGEAVCGSAYLSTAEMNRRALPANLRFRWYGLPLLLYDQPAPLRLQNRMLKAEVLETGVSLGAQPWLISPHCGQLTADCSPLHRMEQNTSRRLLYGFIHRWTGKRAVRTSRRRCKSKRYFSGGS